MYRSIIVLCVFLSISFAKVTYDNYAVLKIFPDNFEQAKLVYDLSQNDVRYDFWTERIVKETDPVSVMTKPEDKEYLESFLNKHDIQYKVQTPNLQQELNKEVRKRYSRSNTRSMTWDAYYNFEDIESWLEDLAQQYPDTVTLLNIGKSYEGRNLTGIKISHGPGRRAIFLEGTLHAREWITTSAVCYVAHDLLTSTDPDTVRAAQDYDWYLFPVTNPDGYVYSIDVERMWRKNRRPITDTAFGVDLNRNWNNNWLVLGASINPASDVYAGPGPFSEPETRALSAFIRSLRDDLEIYLSVHSYGQYLLIPFGNSTNYYANYHYALNVGRRAMGALSVRYGTDYVTGTAAEVLYYATGAIDDWVKGALNVPLVYCYELRDRIGFVLPVEQILPNNLEFMDSIIDMIHQHERFSDPVSSATVIKPAMFMIATLAACLFR